MNYLSLDEVISVGTEFAGEVCYSGEYGQQVYTKEAEEGGVPVEGILYERYPGGSLNYYCFYRDGIPSGEQVRFYESGKIMSHCFMDTGTIDGEYIEWYENGKIKLKEVCKYGLVLQMQEFDESGNIIKEKKELRDYEKSIFEKSAAYYEGRTSDIDMSRYRYCPEDKRKLDLNAIFFEMKDFRAWYIISIPVWALWGIITAAVLAVYLTEGATAAEWVVGLAIIFVLFLILLGTIPFMKYMAKKPDQYLRNRLLANVNTYLSDIGEDFLKQVQADLSKGLRFLKKHSLVISEQYIFGSVKELGLDPVAIPKEQIQEIAYAIYNRLFHTRGIHWAMVLRQEFYFRLKNGKEINVYVNDRNNPELALNALKECGIKMIDVSPKKKTV